MAWNEPGGNNKDPWGNRGNNQGPPDLDEVFNKFMKKLNGLFGGSGSGGGRNSSGPGSAGIIALVVIGLIIWALTGTYKIGEAERGVVLRFGEHVYTVESGLHWHLPPPIEKVLKVDVSNIQEYAHKSTMLTQDQNIIDIEITVQYQIAEAEKFLFNLRSPVTSLTNATESGLRQHVGQSTMDYVFGDGREDIALSTQNTLQEVLDSYDAGIRVIRVNMQEAKPPEPVKAAFDDVTQSKEDEVKLKNQAEAYRNEILPRARGRAAEMLEEANAYKQEMVSRAEGDAQRFNKLYEEFRKAPGVTRDRIYLESIESVLSQANKVMVDVEGGNNMMYLPLDKILENRSVTRDGTASTGRTTDQSRNIDFNVDDLRNRDSRSRETR